MSSAYYSKVTAKRGRGPQRSLGYMAVVTAILVLSAAAVFALASDQELDAANVASGSEGKINWTVDDKGVLTVTGSGNMPDYTSSDSPWQSYKPTLKAALVLGAVTSIGTYAFSDCPALEAVWISSNVGSIGGHAFDGQTFHDEKGNVLDVTSDNLRNLAFVGSDGDLTLTAIPYRNMVFEQDGIRCKVLNNPESRQLGISGIMTAVPNLVVPAQIKLAGVDFDVFSVGEGGTVYHNPDVPLETLVISEGIQKVGVNAFSGHESLRSVTLPSTLTQVGSGAFSGLVSLNSFSGTSPCIKDGVMIVSSGTLVSCAAGPEVTSISIPSGVTSINTLSGCKYLESVAIPSSMKILTSYSFRDCTSLQSIDIPGTITTFDYGAFWNCASMKTATVGEGITSLPANAFIYCESLESVSLPSTLKKIGYGAFADCKSLKVADIPAGVTELGGWMFEGCSSLVSVTFPDSFDTIGANMFSGCSSLESLDLPDGITKLYRNIIEGCSSLKTFSIPSSVTYIDGTLGYTFVDEDGNLLADTAEDLSGYRFIKFDGKMCRVGASVGDVFTSGGLSYSVISTNLLRVSLLGSVDEIEELAVPSTVKYCGKDFEVTSVAKDAFKDSQTLVSVTLGKGMLRLYSGAFEGCSNLQEVDMGSTLKTIEADAFAGCGSLTTVVVSSKLASLDASAFDVVFHKGTAVLATTPADLKGKTFTGTGGHHYANGSVVKNTVVDTGDMTFKVVNTNPKRVSLLGAVDGIVDMEIPATVYAGGSTYDVTSVAAEAFKDYSGLKSVSMTSVTTIYANAFNGCTSLEYVDLSDVLKTIETGAFAGCGSIKSIGFPTTLSTLSKSAFDCTFHNGSKTLSKTVSALKGLDFEGSGNGHLYVDGIGVGVPFTVDGFVYSIANLNPTRASLIGFESVSEALIIPSSVTYKGKTFDITSVGTDAFKGCTDLEYVALPDGLLRVYSGAFEGCTSLTYVGMPSSLKTIEERAFYGCPLEIVEGPTALSSLGADAFSVTFHKGTPAIDATVKNIKGKFFSGLGGHLYLEGSVKKNTVIDTGDLQFKVVNMSPTRVSLIGGSDGIVDLVVPDFVPAGMDSFAVTSVAEGAFKGNTDLRHVDLGLTTTIYSEAFAGCTSIESVAFSPELKTLYKSAFDCTFYDGKKVLSETPASLKGKYFEGTDGDLYLDGIKIGYTFVSSGLEYSVVNLDPLRVSVTGYTEAMDVVIVMDHVKHLDRQFAVTSIGKGAFQNCTEVRNLLIAEGVLRVYSNAFAGCTNLTVVDFGTTVKTIESNAFKGCTGLEYVAFSYDLSSVSTTSFPATVFKDADGNVLAEKSANLVGRLFQGSDGVLFLVESAEEEA
ncbi:MAG: leucine-rich repeat protein [Candidatus Methanomethylophilaceae archaeon]|nr:leucine-rich repeat protein [Candidatus Methanomethylophilaceae archaeon]